MIEPILFFLSSALTLYLLYLKVSSTIFEQLIAASLVLILILTRLGLSKMTSFGKKMVRLSSVFLSALLIQLLVLSSGGFYSPFLILLHLFTLGTSFLLNLSGAISFLILSLAILILNIFLDPRIMELFRQDIFTVLLYIISFLVIIPLAQLLIRTYHLKTALSNMLSQYLNLGQQREKSILKGLTEIVIITDADLKILSVSEAVERNLKLSAQDLVGNSLFNALPLKDKAGNKLNTEILAIDNILADRATRIINDCYLELSGKLTEIVIQIRPILDQLRKVSQLVFMISDAKDSAETRHNDLEQALKRHQAIVANLKKAFLKNHQPQLNFQVETLNQIEEDLLTALEIEDHPIKTNASSINVAEVCQQIIFKKQELARSLNILIKFVLPKADAAEAARLRLLANNVQPEVLGISNFLVPTDPKWFQLIIQKLLEVAILVAASNKSSEVILHAESAGRQVAVVISTDCEFKKGEKKDDLFTKYYGSFASWPYLNFGSGLEGFIAKMVAEKLNIPLDVNYYSFAKQLKFILKLAR